MPVGGSVRLLEGTPLGGVRGRWLGCGIIWLGRERGQAGKWCGYWLGWVWDQAGGECGWWTRGDGTKISVKLQIDVL